MGGKGSTMQRYGPPLAGLVVFVVILAGGWFLTRSDDRAGDGGRGDRPTETTPGRDDDVEFDYGLRHRTFRVGHCAFWDQEDHGRHPDEDQRNVKVVDCAEPHVFEVTGLVDLPEAMEYPGEDGWRAVIEEHCRPGADEYFGRWDPRGRFGVSAIHPREKGWAQGQRGLACGISMSTGTDPDVWPAFQGAAREQSQQRRYEIGTCLTEEGRPGPCSEGVGTVVVGVVDLAGRVDHAPSAEELQVLLGDECTALATAHLGQEPDHSRVGWFLISPESWAASSTATHCYID